MTATAPPADELKCVFARIEDGQLVEDVDHPGFYFGGSGDSWLSFIKPIRKEYPQVRRDWVALVRCSCI